MALCLKWLVIFNKFFKPWLMKSSAFPILALFLFILTACGPKGQLPPANESGISKALAQFRKEHVKDIRYELFFKLPASSADPVAAEFKLSFQLDEALASLPLDFNATEGIVQNLLINGQEAKITHELEHVILDGKHLQVGHNEVEISFLAGTRSLNRNEDFLYSLLVPDRASTVFPCFDQPNLKSVYSLRLEMPEDWSAIANGAVLEERLGDGRKTMLFGETERIPTYLFAFAAGKFEKAVHQSERYGQMVMLHRESDSVKAARNIPEIFDLHEKALRWMEEYTGIPYPYGKLDFALIPPFQYGGMEHVGAIQYRASSLMLEENPSLQQQMGRASLISHEVAHMWFGDLVTMDWFDDVWMKEVFANFMAAKMVNPSFPEINHELRFLLAHHPAAMGIDRSAGRHPIQQELENLKQAGNLYGPIIYQKAPIMMRQIEASIGEENMQKALQKYLETYAHGNATWDDLAAIIVTVSANPRIEEMMQQWVKEARFPEVDYSVEGTKFTLIEKEEASLSQSLSIASITEDKEPQLMQVLIGPNTMSKFEMPFENAQYIMNADGMAYGYFKTPQATAALSPSLADPLLRAVNYINAYETMLHGDLPPAFMLEVLKNGAERESDPQLRARILGMASSIFARFLPAEARVNQAAIWEELLLRKWKETENPSDKRIWFNTYTGMALTQEALDNLYTWWKEEKDVHGLKLNPGDYRNLAATLALHNYENSGGLIAEQLDRIENPDDKARWAFVSPALSGDKEVRDAFFAKLLEAENRSREPWVTQALGYLNHPLRQQEALAYLPQVLEELEEVQLTGDIFFPKAWLDAALGGHNSREAAAVVQQFLDTHPDYNPRLRQKLLQSADMLFRSADIVFENPERK
jgi:aminopeptidase N